MRKLYKLIKGIQLLAGLAGVVFQLMIIRRKRSSVLILAQHVHVGGTASYFQALCTYFRERGYEIDLLLRKQEFTSEVASFVDSLQCSWHLVDHELEHLEYWYDRKHVLRFYFLYNFLEQSLYLGRMLMRSRSRLLFVSNAYPGDLFPAFLLPVQTRFVIHSMPWGNLDRGNRYMLEKIFRLFPNYMKLSTVSVFAKNRILKYWQVQRLDKQLLYLHNYSPLANNSDFYPDRGNKGNITVLTAGSVIKTKNPSLWIRVAKKIIHRYPEVQFVWAGEGIELAPCQNEVSGHPNIHFLGKAENMTYLYKKADVYFQPSKWESQGLAVLEAMSYGLPCVVTSKGGAVEMVENGISGFAVPPDNEAENISKLEKLIVDPSLRNEMGNRAFQRFKCGFSREHWYSGMDKLIEA
jgi:glycosyltransferase involved in cell wall biosynthesis